MSSPERAYAMSLVRVLAAGWLFVAAAACQLQPMYGHGPVIGAGTSLREALRDVEVASISGRIGNELRNDLIYELTGGAGNQIGAPYRLTLVAHVSAANPIVNRATGLPESETIAFDVTYKLEDVVRDRIVLTEKALARISIDRNQQRFAYVRAVRDAENRAAKVVAEQIRARLASYFLTRT
jgi:LPS-assembly lipoprotein